MFTLRVDHEDSRRVCACDQYTVEKMADGRIVVNLYRAGAIEGQTPIGSIGLDEGDRLIVMNDRANTVEIVKPGAPRPAVMRGGVR